MMVITSLTGDLKHRKAMSMRPNGFTRQMKLWRPRHVIKPCQAALICYSTRELLDSLSSAYHVWLTCNVTSWLNIILQT